MNNPFDYTPSARCAEAFGKLLSRIESLKGSDSPEDAALIRELEAGKMLGVLIASDAAGRSHTLYAFSGQLGDRGFHHPMFVEPVFDYLDPDGYFRTYEADISRQNIVISHYEETHLSGIRGEYCRAEEAAEAEVDEFKEICRRNKAARDVRRQAGDIEEDQLAEMIRQSQFEKAELRRIRKRCAERLAPAAMAMKDAESRLADMKARRRADSEALQKWLFDNFKVLDARGVSRSLSEIFAATPLRVPPSGAGECCAPKLLQAAYVRGWRPESMAEYWYGRPKDGEVRIHGAHYPACRGKCLPVLGWMLRGLDIWPPLEDAGSRALMAEPEIIYENEWFCIVGKPAGMLSVPGKGSMISIQQWLAEKYGPERDVRMAHRLDQDTSGLLIAAFGLHSYKVMQTLFATRKVKKTYVADLEGNYEASGVARTGRMELSLSPDPHDRPRQRIDNEAGKDATTDYEFVGATDGSSRVMFRPLTGRTHQLRVHAAAGLGMPIVGDRLYGRNAGSRHERLHLHAHRLEFTFPIDGHHYCFESAVPF